jgi:hypothetical protein
VEISFEGGQVIVPIPKAVLVLTREQFIEALRRGKVYRRRQARQARVAPIEDHQRVTCDGQGACSPRKACDA